MFGGRHSKAILGDLLAVMLNNSMATYKIAGPQVAVEKEIIKQVNKLLDILKVVEELFQQEVQWLILCP